MQTIKKILCATDLSDVSDRLLSFGVALCLRFGATCSVFHSVPPPFGSVARQIEFERGGEKKEKKEIAHAKIQKFMEQFDIKWDFILTCGDPVIEVEKAAERINADIVIAASLGLSGVQQFFIGSVIGRMAKTVLQPLLVIPPLGKSHTSVSVLELEKIILACSLRNTDSHLIKYAKTFSEKFNSEICLVHVMESPVNDTVARIPLGHYDDAQRRLEEKVSLRLENLMPARTHILHGVPGEELAAYAKREKTDLIIAGVDNRPGRLIATTTAALLRQLPCAVLAVPIKTN